MTNPGEMLAHYRLVEPIGRGGMGEVWKAIDTTLDRVVAIKLLPAGFSRDADRLARFEREAKVLASLNHPGIAQVYGFHQDGGHHFLAMELVEGEDLAARLKRGPLTLEETLTLGRQVAEALEEAHEHGVVHRDLKPANIVLGPDGGAKVLDFGLAKVHGHGMSSPSSDVSLSPTITSLGTQDGVILGTAAYMSPEQARAKPFDRRTDIWAFGCVLFEALSGERLFAGETISDTIALILQSRPDGSLLPPGTPRRLRALVERCLEKDPRERLRDIGDARVELERLIDGRDEEPPDVATPPPAVRRRGWATPVVLVVGLVAGAAGWALLGRDAPGTTEPTHVSVDLPPGYRAISATLTPDGRTILFDGRRAGADAASPEPVRLFARSLGREDAAPVPGTEGVQGWATSPDSRWVAYVAPVKPDAPQRRLYKVPLDGSAPPLALADWASGWNERFVWLDAGRLLVSSTEPVQLITIRADGSGTADPLPVSGGEDILAVRLVDVLPGGSHVLADSFTWDQKGYHDRVYVLDARSGELRKLLDEGSYPRWSATGHLLFTRLETLLAAPMDPDSRELTGGAVGLRGGLRTGFGDFGATFDLSRSGTLLTRTGGRLGSRRRLVTFEEPENVTSWSDDRMSFVDSPKPSPDGRYVAVTVMSPDELLFSVWISEFDRPRLRRFLAMPVLDCNEPVWLPQGLAAHCEGNTDEAGIYLKPVDGGPARLLYATGGGAGPTLRSGHPDGDRILVQKPTGNGSVTLDVPIASEGTAAEGRSLFPDDPTATNAQFSPDGRLVAYLSRSSGRTDLLVAPYDRSRGVGPPVLAAVAPTSWLEWKPTGTPGVHDLLFGRRRGVVEAVRVRTEGLSIGDPRLYLDFSEVRPILTYFEAVPGGGFLAVQEEAETDGDRRVDLVLGFEEELRRPSR